MGYYTRVFCTSSETPTLQKISSQLEAMFKNCRIEFNNEQADDDWESFWLYYKENKLPLLVELNKIDDKDNLANDEIEEFIEEIGSPLFSLSKRKVINHLLKSKYVVAIQLPASDIDDDGYEINGTFMQIFASGYGGMVQADKEGFYLEKKLILKNK